MKKTFFHLLVIIGLVSSNCSGPKKARSGEGDHKIEITFVLINDVYEIAPLEDGKIGGMARVASLKKEYLAKNPNTLLVIAGDFLSPSVFNSLQYNGKRIRGKQMVASMNAAGVDIAVFGNHEFDINESELQERINESAFGWVASNVFHKRGNTSSPFVKMNARDSTAFPESYILTVKDADGTTAKIGFIGLTLPFNKAAYVSYTDPLETAERLYNRIKDSCDAVVAITHQAMEDDIILAQKLPGLAFILGGHEHDMRFQKVGNVYIAKAHANARSAYIVPLKINTRNHHIKTDPQLKMLDASVPLDPSTNEVVKTWMDIGSKNYASLGFDPKKVVMQSGEPLDGREISIRTHPTNLTNIIVMAMQKAAPLADAVIVNAGAIRVDDIVPAPVTQYDIIRSLPFGGGIVEADMKGSLFTRTLEAGRKNRGIGGYLHFSPDLRYDSASGNWSLKNIPLDPERTYRVGMVDFLMTGGEANMGFLTKDNPGILKVYPPGVGTADLRSDIRLAIVHYMETNP